MDSLLRQPFSIRLFKEEIQIETLEMFTPDSTIVRTTKGRKAAPYTTPGMLLTCSQPKISSSRFNNLRLFMITRACGTQRAKYETCKPPLV